MNKMLTKTFLQNFIIYIDLYLFQIQKSFKFYHNFNITIYAKNVVRLYDCMRQPDNSKLSMEVRLLEKIYHPSSNSNLSTPIHKQKGRILDLKAGYCNAIMGNDKIDSICSLSSPRCSNVKVMNIFNNTPRRKWSHGHQQSTHHLHGLSIYIAFFCSHKKYQECIILQQSCILYHCHNYILYIQLA